MDPHYWPSLYPGIAIGLLVGFASGGWLAMAVGAIGGLVGAVLGLSLNQWLGFTDGFLALAVPALCSGLIAKALIVLVGFLKSRIGKQGT